MKKFKFLELNLKIVIIFDKKVFKNKNSLQFSFNNSRNSLKHSFQANTVNSRQELKIPFFMSQFQISSRSFFTFNHLYGSSEVRTLILISFSFLLFSYNFIFKLMIFFLFLYVSKFLYLVLCIGGAKTVFEMFLFHLNTISRAVKTYRDFLPAVLINFSLIMV